MQALSQLSYSPFKVQKRAQVYTFYFFISIFEPIKLFFPIKERGAQATEPALEGNVAGVKEREN
jgi:hypothetical protein